MDSFDLSAIIEVYQFLNHSLFQGIDEEIAKLKLTKMDLFILLIVALREGVTMTELAQEVGTSKVQISRWITNLEQMNLVKRQHNTKNRRMVNVYLTSEGKAIHSKRKLQFERKLEENFATLPSEEFLALKDHFAVALAILQKTQLYSNFLPEC
ncbi:MAG: MarR family transcriptional regulator [Enterococcus sp.]|nr:MarR family transcriptional regulator [Enterococcus sp.]